MTAAVVPSAEYPEIEMLLDGQSLSLGDVSSSVPIINPADESTIAYLPVAGPELLDRAAAASAQGFEEWRAENPRNRAAVLLRAADLLEERLDSISTALTLEQGKPVREAKAEWQATIDLFRWFAEEGRRTYGRVISGVLHARHLVVSEPVGPVVALTPWNVPALAAGRKVAPALAAGCSVILKGPSETPSASYEIVKALHEAGVPPLAVQAVYGEAAQVSERLIGSSHIRKVSFTGSTRVGRIIAGLAAQGLKRSTLELGGHAPVLVFPDVDVEEAARNAAQWKFRNAGQICVSPTRFIVHEDVLERFVDEFAKTARGIRLGSGLDPDTAMGPLLSNDRVRAVQSLVDDAVAHGAEIVAGGRRVDTKGFFFEPTVIKNIGDGASILQEEPFGPVAPVIGFSTYENAVEQANSVNVGLAAFVITDSARIARAAAADVQAGIVGVNDYNCSRCEIPFGGVKDTGWGQEGGTEGIEPYLVKKAILSV
ncbi:NAD-dependent succinate-semialdehyde dehydrogenase [Rhodococcus sp. WMMA185]|uniref:NAD-dependent succinate-semialdehyde dehydrogenase n=1 Tax=Rhodococcus sp. WMMA185 TaxID=679318 RepID=UPI000878C5F0|nr:NAD-dependent succinate-semialdehyde dehydrogenase [Rhodococcus sp. WMMA185]AOW92057.1 NAD-dependent succinate-semialdehyde dehydrogenase [Rhodococcus sp. WMMA185]